ncbi:MAG TPA: methyltransferase domain-containing protein [Gammaproteobacteria bacterium]|nr:methyltransferase domain-containing protein [Gammaproteobacteria bacterium]
MSAAGMTRMFLREIFGRTRQPRGPTPSAALGSNGVLAAMEDGGEVDGRTAAGYLYHSARISQVLIGRRRCVDVGCGNGMQLLQVAALNPAVHFTGVDPSPRMLEAAAARAAALDLRNVDFEVKGFDDLLAAGRGPWDAAISTMTLHDLPDLPALERALQALSVAAGPNGALYVEDFARLKSPLSVEFFVDLDAPSVADRFSALYRCSLLSAFTVDELRDAVARRLPQARLYHTFLVPFLTITKTGDGPLPAPLRQRLAAMRAALPPTQRRALDDLRRFFLLGGLGKDPFR